MEQASAGHKNHLLVTPAPIYTPGPACPAKSLTSIASGSQTVTLTVGELRSPGKVLNLGGQPTMQNTLKGIPTQLENFQPTCTLKNAQQAPAHTTILCIPSKQKPKISVSQPKSTEKTIRCTVNLLDPRLQVISSSGTSTKQCAKTFPSSLVPPKNPSSKVQTSGQQAGIAQGSRVSLPEAKPLKSKATLLPLQRRQTLQSKPDQILQKPLNVPRPSSPRVAQGTQTPSDFYFSQRRPQYGFPRIPNCANYRYPPKYNLMQQRHPLANYVHPQIPVRFNHMPQSQTPSCSPAYASNFIHRGQLRPAMTRVLSNTLPTQVSGLVKSEMPKVVAVTTDMRLTKQKLVEQPHQRNIKCNDSSSISQILPDTDPQKVPFKTDHSGLEKQISGPSVVLCKPEKTENSSEDKVEYTQDKAKIHKPRSGEKQKKKKKSKQVQQVAKMQLTKPAPTKKEGRPQGRPKKNFCPSEQEKCSNTQYTSHEHFALASSSPKCSTKQQKSSKRSKLTNQSQGKVFEEVDYSEFVTAQLQSAGKDLPSDVTFTSNEKKEKSNLGMKPETYQAPDFTGSAKSNTKKLPSLDPVIRILQREILRVNSKTSLTDKKVQPVNTNDHTFVISGNKCRNEPKAPIASEAFSSIQETALDLSGRVTDNLIVKGYHISFEKFNAIDDIEDAVEVNEEEKPSTEHLSAADSSGIGTGLEDFSGEEIQDSCLQIIGTTAPNTSEQLNKKPSEDSILEQQQLELETTLEADSQSEVVPVEEMSGEIIEGLVIKGTQISGIDVLKSCTTLDLTDGEQDEVFEEDMVKGDTFNASRVSDFCVEGKHVDLDSLESTNEFKRMLSHLTSKNEDQNKTYVKGNDDSKNEFKDMVNSTIIDARNFKNTLGDTINSMTHKCTVSEPINHLLQKASWSAACIVRALNQVLSEIQPCEDTERDVQKSESDDEALRQSSPVVTESFDKSVRNLLITSFVTPPRSEDSKTSIMDISTSMNKSQATPKTPCTSAGINDSLRIVNNSISNLTNLSAEFSSDEPASFDEVDGKGKEVVLKETNQQYITLQEQGFSGYSSALVTRNVFISPSKEKRGFKTGSSLEKSVTFDEGLSPTAAESQPKTSTPKTQKEQERLEQSTPAEKSKIESTFNTIKLYKDAKGISQMSGYHPGWNFDYFISLQAQSDSIWKMYKIPKATKTHTESIDDHEADCTNKKLGDDDDNDQSLASATGETSASLSSSITSASSTSENVTPPTRGNPQKRKKGCSKTSKRRDPLIQHKEKHSTNHPPWHSNKCHPLLIDKSAKNICKSRAQLPKKRHRPTSRIERKSSDVMVTAKARGIKEREKCFQILNAVYNYKESDIVCMEISSEDIPDYHSVVKYPMCLDVIARKLRQLVYNSFEEFVSDFRRVFYNCRLYYKDPGCEERISCDLTEEVFENILRSTFPNENFTAITGSPPHGKRAVTSSSTQQEPKIAFPGNTEVPGLLRRLIT